MSDDIEKQLRALMVEHLDIDPDQLHLDSSFSKQLDLDSLDAMDLLLAIDEAMGVRVNPDDMAQIDTLQQLIDAVSQAQQQSSQR